MSGGRGEVKDGFPKSLLGRSGWGNRLALPVSQRETGRRQEQDLWIAPEGRRSEAASTQFKVKDDSVQSFSQLGSTEELGGCLALGGAGEGGGVRLRASGCTPAPVQPGTEDSPLIVTCRCHRA